MTNEKRCDKCAHTVPFRAAPNDIHSALDCRAVPPHYAVVPVLDPRTNGIVGANTQIMPRVVPPDHWCALFTARLSVLS
jgi:hypothetical protein